ncbi:MAG: acetate--CoA ligase [Chloroflexi bacterium]|nr:acetate--CoA ligase [Chloroflexota bacterium]
MSVENRKFPPSKEFTKNAYIKSMAEYKKIYKRSIDDMEGFWAEQAAQIDWYKKWDKVLVSDFKNGKHEWFVGGKLNVSYNCLDRNLTTWRKNKAAIIWEGDIGDSRTYTYEQLWYEVNKAANVLKKQGIKKGDRVTIYLPMIPELAIAMLACTRIGAIHCIVFGGFSADALKDRIVDSESTLLISVDGYYRAGKVINSKANADQALQSCPKCKKMIVVNRANNNAPMVAGRDVSWNDEMAQDDVRKFCEPEKMDAEDPLFILYTSGSTGKPKGVLHTTAGYLLYVMTTFKWIFDYKDVPNYPKPDRFWDIIEKYKINIIYTAPTALRAIMKDGDDWVKKHDLSSLRLLGTVGEPINPEAWMWYYNVIGGGRCPIVDTWWQTETGGILITPLPGAWPIKPGSATLPFPGVACKVIREDRTQAGVNEGGSLVIEKPWPGLMRGVYNDPDRFKNTYFIQNPGVYTTGDGARVDEDGYFWLMGRIDDVINVSGHRIGTAEVESALVSHPKVAEAAVVGMPHDIKGQGIYAYVTLKSGVEKTDDLKKELIAHLRKEIGPIASPDKIQWADFLPKTRSGKIMRRILTKIAANDVSNLGDTSTLADPTVVDDLVKNRV